jgi:hypothetical protein
VSSRLSTRSEFHVAIHVTCFSEIWVGRFAYNAEYHCGLNLRSPVSILVIILINIRIYDNAMHYFYSWRVSSSGIWRRVVRCVATDVSEEHRASIFRVKEKSSKPTSKQVATLKMEALCSSETSVATQRTTRRHIPEDDTLHNHRCENLKSYISILDWVY